jgi:hypothetical protein
MPSVVLFVMLVLVHTSRIPHHTITTRNWFIRLRAVLALPCQSSWVASRPYPCQSQKTLLHFLFPLPVSFMLTAVFLMHSAGRMFCNLRHVCTTHMAFRTRACACHPPNPPREGRVAQRIVSQRNRRVGDERNSGALTG